MGLCWWCIHSCFIIGLLFVEQNNSKKSFFFNNMYKNLPIVTSINSFQEWFHKSRLICPTIFNTILPFSNISIGQTEAKMWRSTVTHLETFVKANWFRVSMKSKKLCNVYDPFLFLSIEACWSTWVCACVRSPKIMAYSMLKCALRHMHQYNTNKRVKSLDKCKRGVNDFASANT